MVWVNKNDDASMMPWNLRQDVSQKNLTVDGAVKKRAIPESITDLHVNLQNRQHAIDEYLYGPLNPDAPGDYWHRLGNVWNVSAEEAATSRCGNCAAFNRKPEMLDAIADAISDEGDAVVDAAYLGYCELFDFKCAGARACSAWLTGGPLTQSVNVSKEKECSCWDGYERVPNTEPCQSGSCRLRKAEKIKVGDFVQWNSSGGTARGKVQRVVREGKANVPDSSFSINAEPDDPALLIRVWRPTSDGFSPSDTVVGHKMSSTKRIADLT